MIIPTGQTREEGSGELEVGNFSDSTKYITIWQDSDLVLVYVDQVDALIAELQKLKENA